MNRLIKIFLPVFIILLSVGNLQAQERPIKQYIYVIEENGAQEDYIISVYKDSPEREFSWSLKSSDPNSGRITIKDNIRKTSTAHLFITMDDGELTDKTAVWVSDKLYSDLKKGSASVDFGNGTENIKLIGREDLETLVGGKKQKIKVLRGMSDKGTEVWIMDDAKNPILFKVKGGQSVWLKEII